MNFNPFADVNAYGFYPLSQAINVIPNTYGRLNALGLFEFNPITTNVVIIEAQNQILTLLPSKERGAPGSESKHGKRTSLTFKVPHIPLKDIIKPEDYANVRAFGTQDQNETYAGIMARYLAENRRKFEITWEFLKWGALKGLILDGDGTTTLYNLYSAFGITQKTVDFALDDDTTNVQAKCFEVSRHIEDNLRGDVSTGVRCMVSREFFDAFAGHDKVKEYYLNQSTAAELVGKDIRKGFTFSGITFEEFSGQAPNGSNGDNVRFIASGEGHAFPEGTMATFRGYASPGDFIDTVNTPGMELYARQQLRDFNKGVDLWFESNVLPLCLRPGVLVKVTA